MSAASFHEPTAPDRGISYADGGVSDLNVHYPDPERVARINAEWAAYELEATG